MTHTPIPDIHAAAPPAPAADLSVLLLNLLKGVQYRDNDERQWAALLNLQARVRDYAAILNLELILDDAEGHAYLKSCPEPDDDPAPRLPRLMARRPLSFPVSLVLALLRKKLAEFDASGGDTRLVLDRNDIVELVRVFLPEGPNEARLIDQIDSTVNKVVELGFLTRLKPPGGNGNAPAHFEVKRILKAFVDAQWLAEFDSRLAAYQTALSATSRRPESSSDE